MRIVQKYKSLSIPVKASIAYTIANFVSKGINVITIPLFTRIMSTYEVGVSTTYSSWYSILYAIVTLSLCSGSINIAMLDYKGRRDEYESACLTLSSISGIVFAILYTCFSSTFDKFTTLDSPVMWIMVVSLIINPALDFWYARQRYEYKYKSTVIVSIAVSGLSAITSILAVIVAKNQGIANLGNVKVISQGVIIFSFASVIYIYIFRRGKTFVDLSIWRYALILSVPLIVHALAKNVLDVSDRIMISYLKGKSDAGIYGTVYSVSMISLLVWNAVNSSIIPTTFEKLDAKKYQTLDKLYFRVLLLFGVVSFLVTLLAPEILFILTPSEYYGAVTLIPALAAGVYFTALYNIYGNMLLYKKKTVNIMLGTAMTAILNIILNYIFIDKFGYVAAAYTTFFSFVVLALFQGFMVRSAYGGKIINDGILFILSAIVSVLCICCNFIYNYRIIRHIIILLSIIALCVERKKILAIFYNKIN